MAITATTTLSEALAEYNGSCGWEGDLAKAQTCLAAVRWLLINRPQRANAEGVDLNYAALESEYQALRSYVAGAAAATDSTRCRFTRAAMRY